MRHRCRVGHRRRPLRDAPGRLDVSAHRNAWSRKQWALWIPRARHGHAVPLATAWRPKVLHGRRFLGSSPIAVLGSTVSSTSSVPSWPERKARPARALRLPDRAARAPHGAALQAGHGDRAGDHDRRRGLSAPDPALSRAGGRYGAGPAGRRRCGRRARRPVARRRPAARRRRAARPVHDVAQLPGRSGRAAPRLRPAHGVLRAAAAPELRLPRPRAHRRADHPRHARHRGHPDGDQRRPDPARAVRRSWSARARRCCSAASRCSGWSR